MKTQVKSVAFGGMMAALAITVMAMVGLIPIATYVCPMLCMLLLLFVKSQCGYRIGWAWYGAVAVLSALMGPDKEAAGIFIVLGYYPLVKPYLDKFRCRFIVKALFFNIVIILFYLFYSYILGVTAILEDFQQLGFIGLCITLALGNVCFLLLDYVINMLPRKWANKKTAVH